MEILSHLTYNANMMTSRQSDILAAIIEAYAEVGHPIGSVTLAKLFNVASSTIRGEMGILERLGYIRQPHISAGRIPTDKGLSLVCKSSSRKRTPDRFF